LPFKNPTKKHEEKIFRFQHFLRANIHKKAFAAQALIHNL